MPNSRDNLEELRQALRVPRKVGTSRPARSNTPRNTAGLIGLEGITTNQAGFRANPIPEGYWATNPDMSAYGSILNTGSSTGTGIFVCNICQKKEDSRKSPAATTAHGLVCQSCYEKMPSTPYCTLCNRRAMKDFLVDSPFKSNQLKKNSTICKDCRERWIYTCENCGEVKYSNAVSKSIILIDNEGNCVSANPEAMGRAKGIQKLVYCSDCKRENFFDCSRCGATEKRSVINPCSNCDNYLCRTCSRPHAEDCIRKVARGAEGVSFYKGNKVGKVLTIDRFIGVEIEAEQGDSSDIYDLPPGVDFGSDGSLDQTGIEVRTPPASLNVAEDIIVKTCKIMREAGFKGTKKAGLHVHIDCRDIKKDADKIGNLIKTFYATEDILYSMLPYSRWNNRYCYMLNKDYMFSEFKRISILLKKKTPIDQIWYKSTNPYDLSRRKAHKYDQTRYFGLNVHSIFYRGTIEMRYHSGTVSERKILNWVEILLHMVDYAINRYDEDTIRHLYNIPTSQEKLEKFWHVFRIPTEIQEYMTERIALANKDFEVKFNDRNADRDEIEKLMAKRDNFIANQAKELRDAAIESGIKYYKSQTWGGWYSLSKNDREIYITRRSKELATEMLPKELKFVNKSAGFLTHGELNELVRLLQFKNASRQKEIGGDIEY